MLRSKATLPALQKTYDESYLTCSTAVYYEGQVSAHPPPGGSLLPRLSPRTAGLLENSTEAVSLADRYRFRATRRRQCAAGNQP